MGKGQEIPWWSRAWDSAVPLQGARVQFLVKEIGHQVPYGAD